jgi:hypothetical protein
MKKLISIVIITIMFVVWGFASHYEHNYTRQATVVRIDCFETIAKDNAGHYWTFKGSGFKVDDVIALKMYDNYTPNNIHDDIIKGVER